MKPITITIPAIAPEIVQALETQQVVTVGSITQAVAMLREMFSRYAKHAGYIKSGHISETRDVLGSSEHLVLDGNQVQGLLAVDGFDRASRGPWKGVFFASQLYLTTEGWIEIERVGSWDARDHISDCWQCGDVFMDGIYPDADATGGHVKMLSDAEVAESWHFESVVEGLGAAMNTMVEKLPQRTAKLKQTQMLADRLRESLQPA